MREKRTAGKLLAVSIGGYFLCGASVLLLPLAFSEGNEMNAAGYALGILFWLGLAAGSIFFIQAWLKVKDSNEYMTTKGKTRPGCMSFFRTKAAAAADCICIAALAVTIAGNYTTAVPYMVTLAAMFLLIFSFCLRLILNGRVWGYVHGSVKDPGLGDSI